MPSKGKAEARANKPSKAHGKGNDKGKAVMVEAEAVAKEALKADPIAAVVAESGPKKMLTLKSSDDEAFEVEESLAKGSDTLKSMIEDNCTENGIPLPNITSPTLVKIIDYWTRHAKGDEGSKDIKVWDAKFAKCGGDYDMRYDLILAANYLDAKPLLDLLTQACADEIKSMKVEAVRQYFGYESDWVGDEEKKVREQNAWAFE